jgi:hypothetical protein
MIVDRLRRAMYVGVDEFQRPKNRLYLLLQHACSFGVGRAKNSGLKSN